MRSPLASRVAAFLLVVALSTLIWPTFGEDWMEKITDAAGPAAVADSVAPVAVLAEYPSAVVEPETKFEKDPPLDSGNRLDSHNACSETCRFLFTPWIGGQETRAQEHLYRWGLIPLAVRIHPHCSELSLSRNLQMNRTLVLPNVDHSKFGVCQARSFGFFYKEDALSSLGIPVRLHYCILLYPVAPKYATSRPSLKSASEAGWRRSALLLQDRCLVLRKWPELTPSLSRSEDRSIPSPGPPPIPVPPPT